MDLEINKKNYKKKNISPISISLGFLIFSIVLTGGLYFYNISLVSDNNTLDNKINTISKSIDELEKDSDIVVLSLYNANKGSINKLEDYSRLSDYIDHIIKLRGIYDISFKGFNYSSGKLTSEVIASSDSNGNNYKKVVKFIKDYRENEDKSSLFDLDLIKKVTAKNDLIDNVFNIELILKDNITKIFEEAELEKIEIQKQKELDKLEQIEEEKARKQAVTDKLKTITENISKSKENQEDSINE